jgi:hypothetical protein
MSRLDADSFVPTVVLVRLVVVPVVPSVTFFSMCLLCVQSRMRYLIRRPGVTWALAPHLV